MYIGMDLVKNKCGLYIWYGYAKNDLTKNLFELSSRGYTSVENNSDTAGNWNGIWLKRF